MTQVLGTRTALGPIHRNSTFTLVDWKVEIISILNAIISFRRVYLSASRTVFRCIHLL